MNYTIDINADLGEGSGHDQAIMPLISSCSIACGGHYGNDKTIREAVRLAQKHGVKVGAHPSFPDQDNFGREIVTMTKEELKTSVYHQLLQFYAICETEEIPVHHIKLHGALYNYASKDAPTADAVVEAIIATKVRPKLYVQYEGVLHKKAENLLPLSFEAFIDRRYTESGTLVSRKNKDATIQDPQAAWQQLKKMITEQKTITNTGKIIPVTASTFCIHGDHEHSVAILKYIHSQLSIHNVSLG